MKKLMYTGALGICLMLGACNNDRNGNDNTESPAETDDMDNTDDEMNNNNTDEMNNNNQDTTDYNNNNSPNSPNQ